jgi:hypothetical protein
MKTSAKGLLIGLTTVAMGAAGTIAASANWSSTSSASGHGQLVSMPRGVEPNAVMTHGKAVVSWRAQTIAPGIEMTSYVVTARDTDKTPRSPVTHTVIASGTGNESTSFDPRELAGGSWNWAITPRFDSWVGAEGEPSKDELAFAAVTPTTALAAAVTAAIAPNAPGPATVESTEAPASTTEPPVKAPAAETTTSAPEKPITPEKTESTKADPSPSEASSEVDPSPSGSTSE